MNTCKIVELEDGSNAFVVQVDGVEQFRIHFPSSVIRNFFVVPLGYLLLFQCRSAILKEKGNLVLVSPAGEILWWAERLKSDDCYVEVKVQNDEVVAYDGTNECFLDITTGKIKQINFVK